MGGGGIINKKMKLQEGEGYDNFQKLSNDLLILIFTKLSDSGARHNTFADILSLGRCSSVSKRFNAISCLVPTLTIIHPSLFVLHGYCPKILKKFKHIRSLNVQHYSVTTFALEDPGEPLVFWDAVYEPRNYCLAVVTCTRVVKYNPQETHSMMHADVVDNKIIDPLTHQHGVGMFFLHHIIVASIKEHKMLQNVVVYNFKSPTLGRFTLDEEKLAELRNENCSINLAEIQTRHTSSVLPTLDFQLTYEFGFVMHNMCLNIFEWWENTTDNNHKEGIPPNLPGKGFGGFIINAVLKKLFVRKGDLKIDRNLVSERLSKINSKGILYELEWMFGRGKAKITS